MTVIVQQPTDINGNPQPMVYDSDTKKVIVDSNGFIVSGGQKLVNIPSKANYVSTPKTQSDGLYEAINYGIATGIRNGTGIFVPEIKITSPLITISAPITVQAPSGYTISQLKIVGISSMTYVGVNLSNAYAITLDPSSFSYVNMRFENIQPAVSGGTPYGFLNADFSTTNTGFNVFEGYNLDVSNPGWATAPFYLTGFGMIVMYNYEAYTSNSTTYGNGYFDATNIFFYGTQGSNASYYFSNALFVHIAGLSQDTVSVGTAYGSNLFLTNVVSALIEDVFAIISLGSDITNLVVINHTQGSSDPYNLASSVSGTSRTITNFKLIGYYNYGTNPYFSSDIVISKPTVSISANPPVSATVYQNTNPYDIEIDLPVYATTAGTAGYVTIAKGATSTPSAIGNQYVSGDTSDTSEQIIRLRVPANWYYEFTASGVTFGTASVFAD